MIKSRSTFLSGLKFEVVTYVGKISIGYMYTTRITRGVWTPFGHKATVRLSALSLVKDNATEHSAQPDKFDA